MASKVTTIRFNDSDQALIKKLKAELKITSTTDLIRLSLRATQARHNKKTKAS